MRMHVSFLLHKTVLEKAFLANALIMHTLSWYWCFVLVLALCAGLKCVPQMVPDGCLS